MYSLEKPDYKAILDFADGTNEDIRNTIHKRFPRAVEQTKDFAKQFKGGNARETAYNIWKFEKEHIDYKKDPKEKQLVRLPPRFIYTQKGDCKSYALTAAALLANNGLPVRFIYASYDPFNSIPSHVYTATTDENGKQIIVDGVWKYFDSEKKPSYRYHRDMKIYTLSGTDSDIGRAKKKKKGFLKKIGKGIKKVAKKVKDASKKIALAPSRRAYRTMVALNLFGMARKLKRVYDKDPKNLEKKWKQLGGKFSELKKSIKKGYNHWAKKKHKPAMAGVDDSDIGALRKSVAMMLKQHHRFHRWHPKHRRRFRKRIGECVADVPGINGAQDIGAAPLAVALAAAAPIIAALVPLFKKHGEDPNAKEGDETSVERIAELARGAAESYTSATSGNPDAPATAYADPTDPDNADKVEVDEDKDDSPEGTGFKLNPLIVVAALGGGLLLLSGKKK